MNKDSLERVRERIINSLIDILVFNELERESAIRGHGLITLIARASYQKWLQEFPDLFPDAICRVGDCWKTYSLTPTSHTKNRKPQKKRRA